MYITVLFLPLLSFIIIGLLGRVLGRTICKYLSSLNVFLSKCHDRHKLNYMIKKN